MKNETETIRIKEWCKLLRGIKAKSGQTNWCKTRVGFRVMECFLQCLSISFPKLVRILLHFVKSINHVYVHSFLIWI
jgi:hypothetical protein